VVSGSPYDKLPLRSLQKLTLHKPTQAGPECLHVFGA
jgi:hypothetical protein